MKRLFTLTLCWLMAATYSSGQIKTNYEYNTSMPYGTLDLRTRVSASDYYYLQENETYSFRESSPGVRTKTYLDMTTWDSDPYQEGHLRRKIGVADAFIMNYRLLFPDGYKSTYSKGYPLIVHLHGAHERANCLYDNCYHSDWDYTVQENSPPAPTSPTSKLLNNDHSLNVGGRNYLAARNLAGTRLPDDPSMPTRAFPGFVLAAQMMNSWDSLQIQDVVRIVRLLSEKYNIDQDRIYIQGLSIGGYGVYEAMKRASWMFAAALPMASVSDANIFAQNQQDRVAHLPIWIFQGGTDPRPTPEFTEAIISQLEDAGAVVRYSLYSDLGHSVWHRAYGQTDYYTWILGQSKANLHAYAGNTVIDRSRNIHPKLMLAEGFLAYQWEKDGVVLGNTANTLTVMTPGNYRARFSRKSTAPTEAQWNGWSQVVTITETGTPAPTVSVTITNPEDDESFTAPASINFTATASVSSGSLSKVEFYNGETKLGQDTSSPYTFTWSNVSAGEYSLIAKAFDNAGNSATDVVSITVATDTPPSVNITSPGNNQSFTAPASINFTATAADSDGSVARVEFYNGETRLGQDTSSPYTFTWSNVSAGEYSLIAKAFDNAGNSATDMVSITVATDTPPSVNITSPGNNQSFTAPASINFTATAADSDGSVARVEFYNGEIKLGQDASSPYTFTWSNVSAGEYSLIAKAIDNAGNSATDIVTITVATDTPPSVNITSPGNNQSFTAPASINFTATAADSDGSVARVEFYNGEIKLGQDASSPYTFTWSNVSAGEYSLIAKAIDNAGNSATDIVTITVATDTPPTVNMTSPANGQSFTAPASINLAATASDSDGNVEKVEFYNGGTKLGEDNSSPYTFSWNSVPAGNYSLTAKAIDNSGNAASDVIEIIVTDGGGSGESCASTGSIQAETWTGISGKDISSIPVNTAPSSVATLAMFETQANAGDSYGTRVRGYICPPATGDYTFWIATNDNGELWLSTDESPANKTRIAYVSGWTNPRQWDKFDTQRSAAVRLVAGTRYYIEALLKEGSGSDHMAVGWQLPGGALERPIPGSRLISYQTTSNSSPTVNITNPDDGESFTAPASISFTANASDSDGSIARVEFYNGDNKLGQDASSPYTFTWSNVSSGNYSLIAKAIDNSGNSATDMVSINVSTNSPPTVNITSPANNQAFTAPASVNLAATASDADGSVARVEFYNGEIQLGQDASSPYTFTWSNVSAGNYSLIAKAIDDSGNTASDVVEITVNDPSGGSGGSCASTGSILAETWTGIPGKDISSIPVNTAPSSVATLTIFETQANTGDSYGTRVRGYVCPPATGDYIFWIATNDNGELWLSNDESPAGKTRIAYVSGWTNPRQWDKFDTQQSTAVRLVEGNRYYIEALLKEGSGSDHLSVGWQLPGGSLERPIPGSRLVLFGSSSNSSPTVNITSPNNGQSFTAPASVSLTATASDSDGSIAKVEFFNGTTKLGEDNTSPYSFSWNNVAAGDYSLIAKATDNSGNAASDVVDITVEGGSVGSGGSCAATGSILVETWTGIEGKEISSIPLNSSPSSVTEAMLFETAANSGDHYGSRVRGYICPPTTGTYSFWIASNDNGELWLSSDDSYENKTRIAYVSGWTNPREWEKFDTQRSAAVHLVAGSRYYIEALVKEGTGSDHLSVGWQLPGGALERPIPGSRLSQFEMASQTLARQATETTEDAGRYEQISLYPNPARSADARFTVGGYEGITEILQTQVEIINLTGEVVFTENISCGGSCSDYLINVNEQLTPGVYLVRLRTNGVSTSRRLLVK